jgi:hypothetical protein
LQRLRGRLLILGVAAVTVVGALGCGEDNPLGRRPIVGRVTYKTQPVDYGSIQFIPLDVQHGVNSGGMIGDGKYQLVEAQGLPPGAYKVMISAPDLRQQEKVEAMPGDARTFAVERIPKKYNLNTTLQIEVQKGRGSQELNFDLAE